jgi:hypothetical protein
VRGKSQDVEKTGKFTTSRIATSARNNKVLFLYLKNYDQNLNPLSLRFPRKRKEKTLNSPSKTRTEKSKSLF